MDNLGSFLDVLRFRCWVILQADVEWGMSAVELGEEVLIADMKFSLVSMWMVFKAKSLDKISGEIESETQGS